MVEGEAQDPVEDRSATSWISGRFVVSIAGVVAAYFATWLLIPGISPQLVEIARTHGSIENVSVVALGMGPFISAMVLVELAALIVPQWRPLRRTGPAARWKLSRVALALTPVLAFFQGFGVAMYIEGLDAGMPAGWGPRLLTSLTLTAGTALLLAIAGVVHRYGAGNGVSVLLAGSFGPAAIGSFRAVIIALEEQTISLFAAVLGIGSLALPAYATWRISVSSDAVVSDSPKLVRLPASGVEPVIAAASLMVLPATLTTLGLPIEGWFTLAPGSTEYIVVESVLAMLLCAVYAMLFHLPANVRRVAGEAPDRGTMTRAIVASSFFVVSVVLASHVVRSMLPFTVVDVVSVVVLTAVVMDIASELRHRPGWVSVWPIHQLYAAQVAMHALGREGIEFHARGLYHRTLLQFGGPYVPVEIRVPPEDAVRARELVERVLTRRE